MGQRGPLARLESVSAFSHIVSKLNSSQARKVAEANDARIPTEMIASGGKSDGWRHTLVVMTPLRFCLSQGHVGPYWTAQM